jgi:Family of unknown function (DUF6353)
VQLFNDLKRKALFFVEENSSTLLTTGGVVGFVGTAVLSFRAGSKSYENILAERIAKDSERLDEFPSTDELPKLDKLEVVKIAAPDVLPPIITGAATIAAIIMAHRMSAQKIAALAAAYSLAERNFGEYKDKVTEKLTGPKKQAIDDELAQEAVNKTPGGDKVVIVEGEVLCFDKPGGRYFTSTMEQIRQAVNTTNAEIHNHGFALLSFFYTELGLDETTWSEEVGFNAENLLELTFSTTFAPGNRPCIVFDFARLPKADYDPKY